MARCPFPLVARQLHSQCAQFITLRSDTGGDTNASPVRVRRKGATYLAHLGMLPTGNDRPERFSGHSGLATKVPRPITVTTKPSSLSNWTAFSAVMWLTPYSCVTVRRLGRRETSSPDSMRARSIAATWTYSGVALSGSTVTVEA